MNTPNAIACIQNVPAAARDQLIAMGAKPCRYGWTISRDLLWDAEKVIKAAKAAPVAKPAPAAPVGTVLITGETYPVRATLKALGGRWDATVKGWRVPAPRAGEARAAVANAARRPGVARSRSWHPCGYPGCSPSHCDECDGRGCSHDGYER